VSFGCETSVLDCAIDRCLAIELYILLLNLKWILNERMMSMADSRFSTPLLNILTNLRLGFEQITLQCRSKRPEDESRARLAAWVDPIEKRGAGASQTEGVDHSCRQSNFEAM